MINESLHSSPDDEKRTLVMRMVDAQIRKKLSMKRGKRKKLKTLSERLIKKLYCRIFCRSKASLNQHNGDLYLGHDEFGRDVAQGVSKYIDLLKSRDLHLNTVIVLGSRAKGFWKPSSDVDITIIGSNLPKQKGGFLISKILGLRSPDPLSDTPLCLGVEPSGCCSKQEFLKRMENFDLQVLDALYYGKVFYDDGFWSKAKKRFRAIEKQYGLKEAEMKRKLLPV